MSVPTRSLRVVSSPLTSRADPGLRIGPLSHLPALSISVGDRHSHVENGGQKDQQFTLIQQIQQINRSRTTMWFEHLFVLLLECVFRARLLAVSVKPKTESKALQEKKLKGREL